LFYTTECTPLTFENVILEMYSLSSCQILIRCGFERRVVVCWNLFIVLEDANRMNTLHISSLDSALPNESEALPQLGSKEFNIIFRINSGSKSASSDLSVVIVFLLVSADRDPISWGGALDPEAVPSPEADTEAVLELICPEDGLETVLPAGVLEPICLGGDPQLASLECGLAP
jgi:hypothetical protein